METMDTKKEPAKIDIETDLRDTTSAFMGWTRERYPKSFIPGNWVIGQDAYIRKISTCSLETCQRFRKVAFDGLSFVGKLPKERLNKVAIWPWEDLFDLSNAKNYKMIEDLSNRDGMLGLWLGYFLLYLLPTIRLDRCLENNHNARDGFYVHYREILETHPKTKLFLKKALKNLIKPTQKIHRTITEQELKAEEVESYLWEAEKKVFSAFLEENLIRTAKGDKAINFIPNAVKCDYLNENRQILDAAIKERLILDSPITQDSELTFKDTLKSDFNSEEWEEAIDTWELMSQCLELINNPTILTDRERQVISMRYLQNTGEVVPFEEIGKELGITRQTARETEARAIKKLFPHSKPFKP